MTDHDHPDTDLTDPHGEAEALRRENERLRAEIAEATDPDFIWGALDNVYDAETTLDDYAAAVSRAQRAAITALRSRPVGVTDKMINAAFDALPSDACGTIATGEMERVLEAALAAGRGRYDVSREWALRKLSLDDGVTPASGCGDRLGIALLMIANGVANPAQVAREAMSAITALRAKAEVKVKPGVIERIIWSAMVWAAYNNLTIKCAPEYTDSGNSFAEDEARRAAARIRAILALLKPEEKA